MEPARKPAPQSPQLHDLTESMDASGGPDKSVAASDDMERLSDAPQQLPQARRATIRCQRASYIRREPRQSALGQRKIGEVRPVNITPHLGRKIQVVKSQTALVNSIKHAPHAVKMKEDQRFSLHDHPVVSSTNIDSIEIPGCEVRADVLQDGHVME